ncbi:hypothetical protein F0562_029632 [Nyssa sinensis]|uniref:Uncharacterized protein n=1 Tax=Nyssa sinensis TaxID=561372 RepID=A0A5J5B5R2_9ASTE|nr:hypothetical protein F0562_029632 [Nyssa sinensis]
MYWGGTSAISVCAKDWTLMGLPGTSISNSNSSIKQSTDSETAGLRRGEYAPDQPMALLDVYTIEREVGKLDGIKVGLVGDLANGRTVRSLAYLLSKYHDVKIYFVSPEVVKMKEKLRRESKSELLHKGCQESLNTSDFARSDGKVVGDKKPKLFEKNAPPVEVRNGHDMNFRGDVQRRLTRSTYINVNKKQLDRRINEE